MTDALSETQVQQVRQIVREEVPPIVREETADLRADFKRLAVFQEVMYEEMKAGFAMIADMLKIKPRVDDHEERITGLEVTNKLLTKTVTAHSRQLKRAS